MKNRELLRAVIGFIAYILLVPVLLFIAAGTTRWTMAWIYVVIFLLSIFGSRLAVFIRNPDTLRERARFTSAEAVQKWDRLLVSIVGIIGPVLIVIVSGLDYRFKWSLQIDLSLQIIAAILVALSYGMAVWAMIFNRFFSSVVRIQADRNQVVVDKGPYRLVRHPAYAGSVLASLSIPVMLGTLWAFIPSILLISAIVVRTDLEDKFLQNGLPGYQDYSKRTPYRLIPGIW
jgi:protein-S-isoprenylcysteine O-methyltransferase Ste14